MGGSNRRHELRERAHAQLWGGRGLRIVAHSLSITLSSLFFLLSFRLSLLPSPLGLGCRGSSRCSGTVLFSLSWVLLDLHLFLCDTEERFHALLTSV